MNIDMTMLTLSALLCLVLIVPYTLGLIATEGMGRAAGNREGLGEPPGWRGRAVRAHRNLLENMVPFTALILAAQVSQKAGPMTALGAQVFFYARVAHAVIYLAGIPYLRTLAWGSCVVGMGMIAYALFV